MITVIFDLDGTLADTLDDLANAVNYGLEKLGYPVHPAESYKKMVGNGAMKLCSRALPEDKKDDVFKLHEYFREYYAVHYLDSTVLYDGMNEAVHKLYESGAVLAVATNKPQDNAVNMVKKLLPDVEFTKILGGCDERPKKPDPAIIREILDDLPQNDNTVYMVGDSNVDVKTAKNTGLISIGCLWGFRSREELENEGADYVVQSPQEIVDIILKDC